MKEYSVVLVCVLALSVFTVGSVWAAGNSSLTAIEEFKTASIAQDTAAALKAWKDIPRDEGTLRILKENYPYVFVMYELRGLAIQFQELKSRYFGQASISPGRREIAGSRTSRLSNRDIARASTRSNQSINSQGRSTNRDVTRHTPNQDRSSNQERLRNRNR